MCGLLAAAAAAAPLSGIRLGALAAAAPCVVVLPFLRGWLLLLGLLGRLVRRAQGVEDELAAVGGGRRGLDLHHGLRWKERPWGLWYVRWRC